MKNAVYLSTCLMLFMSHFALAEEQLGEFQISDILLQAQFVDSENATRGVSLGDSYLFFNWSHENQYKIEMGLGDTYLVRRSVFSNDSANVSTTRTEEIGLIEAYGEWNSGFGRFRAGVLPTQFTWEGRHREGVWSFPATLSLSENYFGLRDMGISYHISHNHITTGFTVHNGEGHQDTDGNLWYTALWGWENRGIEVGAGAQGGKFDTGSGVRVTKIGNLYVAMNYTKLRFLAQGLIGDVKLGTTNANFVNWHVDLTHPITDTLSVQTRYENFEPNATIAQDERQRWILGLNLTNELSTSTVYLWLIQNLEEQNLNNNELMLVWKLNSLSF